MKQTKLYTNEQRFCLGVCLVLTLAISFCQAKDPRSSADARVTSPAEQLDQHVKQAPENLNRHRPKLAVLISLDQFRADYLERYNAAFDGGFRRMIDEGVWYKRTIVDHSPTLSLPGHATLATGANPRTHGITSDTWLNQRKTSSAGMFLRTYPQRDSNVTTVSDQSSDKSFSPFNVRAEGLADWIRQADPDAKTVSLSVTPLAVLYGGITGGENANNHVYWLGSTGQFITSSYYRDTIPAWLASFNEAIAGIYAQRRVWEKTVPRNLATLAREDKTDDEYDGVHTTFPHTAEETVKGLAPGADLTPAQLYRWFGRYSPYQNNALFDLAKISITQLKLGQRDAVDFMSIAVKLTDRIGRDFGPRSLEQLDVILRLDKILGDFYRFLDHTLGQDNYLVVLSSDHGAPDISTDEHSRGGTPVDTPTKSQGKNGVVPLLFLGKRITPGIGTETAYTRDVAPSIAQLIGVRYSSTVDGKVLKL